MPALRVVLGDQLSRSLSALRDIDIGMDTVLMMEVRDETTYVKHHKQKIVLVLSAMRHFAGSLESEGIDVDYVRLDDPDNSGSFTGVLGRFEAFPVTRDQINMLMEGNTCPSDDLRSLGVAPQRFTAESLAYLATR